MSNATAPTLTEFVLSRIAEDEASARSTKALFDALPFAERAAKQFTSGAGFQRPNGLGTDARVLAECEAKRRIVKLHLIYRGDRIQPIDTSGTDFGCELCGRLDALHSDSLIEAIGYCDTLRALALPYASHPDYNPDWRP